jgi:hypothetical protein
MAKIAIDEGHYNCESGAIGFGVRECDVTHAVAYKLKTNLERQGHTILITNGSLSNRTTAANNWGANIFISLHCNAFNGNAYGIETFCYKFEYRKLADSIHNAMLEDKRLYRVNRGIKEGDLHVIRESNMDACLVEMAFIDNKEDNDLLLRYQDEYATAIANGVQSYLGLSYKEDSLNSEPESTPTSEPTPISAPDIVYQTYAGGEWLPKVTNAEDYAGMYGYMVRGVLADVTQGNIEYRVHLTNGDWLPYVLNVNDFAGASNLNRNIDGLQMELQDVPGYGVEYRAHIYSGWLPWVRDLTDYAGIYGINIDGIQARIYKK